MVGSGPFRARAIVRASVTVLIVALIGLVPTACEVPTGADDPVATIEVSGSVRLRTVDDGVAIAPIPGATVEAWVGTSRVGQTTTGVDGAYTITATGGDLSSVSIVVSVEGFSANLYGGPHSVYAGATRAVDGPRVGLTFTFDEDDDWFSVTLADETTKIGAFYRIQEQVGTAYYVANIGQLQAIALASGAEGNGYTYRLVRPIDASATDTTEWDAWTGEGGGFLPIGWSSGARFEFDGNGFAVANLTIRNRKSGFAGLVGQLSDGGIVRNIVLQNITVAESTDAGGVAGVNEGGTIANVRVSGRIEGTSFVGGITGRNYDTDDNTGTITNAVVTAEVIAASSGTSAGGLVGWLGTRTSGGVTPDAIVSSSFSGVVKVPGDGDPAGANAGTLVGVTEVETADPGDEATWLAGISGSTSTGRVADVDTGATIHTRRVGSVFGGE